MSQAVEPGASVVDLLKRVAWSETSIGDREQWSESLRTAVSICLKSRFPMIIFWGPDFVQIYNDAYMPILGDKHPRALGQRAAECWPEIWDSIGPMLRGVLQTNEATWAENLLLRLQRNERVEDCFFTFSYSPVDEGSRVGGVFCAVHETTAAVLRERESRERAEALAKLDRARTDFVSDVSHELRTPLTLMLGPLEELSKTADESQRPLAAMALRNSLRLLKLVNTLLQFSRIEAGRVDVSFVETDLAARTADIVAMFRSAIESSGLRLVVDMSASTFAYVDRSMWERIVLNLLSNAVKFTLDGEIRVTLVEIGGQLRLSVADTGEGIPSAEIAQIFDRFHRVRTTRSRSHEGSGIGLALVNELVRIHGGTIDVQSELGRGTVFHVDIPLGTNHLDHAKIVEIVPSQASAIDQYLADMHATLIRDENHDTSDGTVSDNGRVLIVDDNADLRAYLFRVLSPIYEVVLASNGNEALNYLRSATFDVVVSDVMMPDIDGFGLLRRVREDLGIASTRFIFLSALAGDESATAGLDLGADDYIGKPFSAGDLLARVRSQVTAKRRASTTERDSLKRWFDRAGDPSTNEAAFRVFADQLPIMLYQQAVDGAVSFTNRVWHDTLRLPRDPSSHQVEAWRRVIHPEDIDQTLKTVSDAIVDRRPWQLEYRLRPADADLADSRWYIARGFPYFTETGEFRGWNCSSIDIHEARLREESERSLREAAARGEREFRALADTIPALIWTTDARGFVNWYNHRWYEYTGRTDEESLGWGWQSVHHPEDFPHVMEMWPRSLASGEPFEMEFRLRRRDGIFHSFLARAVPLRNELGEIDRWYGSCVDVNDQKVALERSRLIAQTLQGAFIPGPVPHSPLFRVDAVYQAADTDTLIGGDWVDAIELPNGRYLFAIGDVTGHGFDASVVAARLRHAIIDFAIDRDSPASVLEKVNAVLRLEHPGVYASALVGFVDSDTLRFSYASAGHHGPLLAAGSDAVASALPVEGCLLGIDDDLGIVDQTTHVPPDAVLTLFTDGIIEFSRDLDNAEAQLKRAVAALVKNPLTHPAAYLRDKVLQGAPTSDDIAILTIQFSRFALATDSTGAKDPAMRWRFHSSDASAAQNARHELMRFIRIHAANEEDSFAAELVLGELLANTVEHAPGLTEVSIDWTGDKPLLQVRDVGPGFQNPRPRLPRSTMDEDGRGLFLIQAMAHDLQIQPTPSGGTEVRVLLPLHRRQSPLT